MVFCHNIFVSPSQDFFTCVEKTTLPLKDFILDIYSSVTAFGQWEFFSLSHRMWHIMWKFHVQICQHLQIQFEKKKKKKNVLFVRLFVWGFSSHSRNFHSFGHIGTGLIFLFTLLNALFCLLLQTKISFVSVQKTVIKSRTFLPR